MNGVYVEVRITKIDNAEMARAVEIVLDDDFDASELPKSADPKRRALLRCVDKALAAHHREPAAKERSA